MMEFKPRFSTTSIGSLPHQDPIEAVEIVLSHLKEFPVWPQLPKRSFNESMYVQFSEGLPGLVTDQEKKVVYIDSSREIEIALGEFYERYIGGDIEYFAISHDHAAGLY